MPIKMAIRKIADGNVPSSRNTHHLSHHINLHPFRSKLRPIEDDKPEDWWFASIAIPLLAATIGPLANVLSIAALVSYWREDLTDPSDPSTLLAQLNGSPIKDPRWATGMNVASLVTGYVGNAFLFFNMTNRVRYLVALPMTIFLWTCSSMMLLGIIVALAVYEAPVQPTQIYSQAYWYAVIAAVLYALCTVLLLVNMIGYMLGHYTERFNLTDAQRTLILQSFMFFIWLAGGAGVFTAVEGWSYSNALYYCDVTILTIGFGDLTPHNSGGRGLVIPYALGGVLILGLLVSSISRFASELGAEKIVRSRIEKSLSKTLERARGPSYSGPVPDSTPAMARPQTLESTTSQAANRIKWQAEEPSPGTLRRRLTMKSRLVVLREEKDRFTTMRKIQATNEKFKKYSTLTFSLGFLILIWVVGALSFWQLEQGTQGMTFFEAFYFCYVSLTTIGYGDYTPQSAGGRPFFVVWSLFAVPSITILIGAASNTVVDSFNKATNRIADFTLLPKHGIWRDFIGSHPKLLGWASARQERIEAGDRLEDGFPVGPEDEEENRAFKPKTIEELATENPNRENRSELGRRLAHAIKQVMQDNKNDPHKRYSYEEWAEWSILIRFTGHMQAAIRHEIELHQLDEPDVKGLLEWDWLGENSPMMSEMSEPEWLLDRLIESMTRYTRNIMAFLRLEKERGVVMDGMINATDDGKPGPHEKLGVSGMMAPKNDEDQRPYRKSDEESYEDGEETQINEELENQRTQDREDEIDHELEKDEKKWDEDDEKRAELNGGRKQNQESYQNGLPGFLGELDGAWRQGRTARQQTKPQERNR